MKRILIVEDDNLLNKMLTYNLASDGYETTSVLNARTAAEKLNGNEYDLVLLDINFQMAMAMISAGLLSRIIQIQW